MSRLEDQDDEQRQNGTIRFSHFYHSRRPKKYLEPTRQFSFSIPVSMAEKFKTLATIQKITQTELVTRLIQKEVEKEHETIQRFRKKET
ncbi:MAG: hypothetical protein ACI4OH_05265 [Mitsuokella sp.]|uniref:hypothetical protein n=1 Tax=Mitsuokella sp. TaxID=2049034 RepID=UPI003F123AF3